MGWACLADEGLQNDLVKPNGNHQLSIDRSKGKEIEQHAYKDRFENSVTFEGHIVHGLKRRIFIYLFFLGFSLNSKLAAQPITVFLQHDSSGVLSTAKSDHKSIKEAFDHLRNLQSRLQEEGYLATSIDSISIRDSMLYAWLHKGEKYKWAKLKFKQTPLLLWSQIKISEREWEGKALNPKKFSRLNEKILGVFEENGYPFAATYLENILFDSTGISATLNIETGPLVKIDTVIVEDEERKLEISETFLSNHLGIRKGDVYDERKLRTLTKRINELPFLEQYRPWKMDFAIDKNSLHLFLKEKKANRLNGIIGLQPNTLETGTFMLTADFSLGLKNSLGYGESIDVVFQNLQFQSPRFKMHIVAPYVLGTPFGLEGSFDLYKKDTTYRTTAVEAGLRYHFNAGDFVKVMYQDFNNRLITPDTLFVLQNKQLPENVDVKSHGIGLSSGLDKTDYKLNPQQGWHAEITVSGMLRKVLVNDAIASMKDASGFDYMALYEQANKDPQQYRLSGTASFYQRLFKNFVGALHYSGGYVSGTELFQNELFRLGGFKLLRGFDEQSIYANQYHLMALELRLLLGMNSYFYVFNDNAFVHTDFGQVNTVDYPISFGAGLSLDNKDGTFSVALGLGKRSGEHFEFRRARVHFGYVAYF